KPNATMPAAPTTDCVCERTRKRRKRERDSGGSAAEPPGAFSSPPASLRAVVREPGGCSAMGEIIEASGRAVNEGLPERGREAAGCGSNALSVRLGAAEACGGRRRRVDSGNPMGATG